MISEEEDMLLMRLADGELPEAEAAALHQRVAADPALAARLADYRRSRDLAAAAFDPVLAAPVPDRLLATLRDGTTAEVVPFRPRARAFVPLALAASVAALIAAPAGWLLGRQAQQVALGDPMAGAGTAIAAALEAFPSGEQRVEAGVSVRPLASHQTAGGICRDFLVTGPAGSALGLACREAGGWRLRASIVLEGGEAIRTASADHPALAALLEGMRAEPPLDAAREAAWLARGWR